MVPCFLRVTPPKLLELGGVLGRRPFFAQCQSGPPARDQNREHVGANGRPVVRNKPVAYLVSREEEPNPAHTINFAEVYGRDEVFEFANLRKPRGGTLANWPPE